MGYLHGGSTSIAYNFNRYFGLVADFAGFDNSKDRLFGPTSSRTFDSDGTAYTYLFGPRFSYRKYERVTPFVQALIGGAYATSVNIAESTSDPSCTPLASENSVAAALGLGFDVKLTHHIALRLMEGDFLLTNFRDPFAANAQKWQKNVRLSSGLVFRFGANHLRRQESPCPLLAPPIESSFRQHRNKISRRRGQPFSRTSQKAGSRQSRFERRRTP